MLISESLKRELEKEIPILRAQVLALYKELDKKTGLKAARVPIEFGFDQEILGSYTKAEDREKEHFCFSLLFIGYAMEKPLCKEDRMDLFKHEYAHYMVQYMQIPEKYRWQPGTHGSAWKYCCSIVGAVPTPYYKAGEALMKPNYEKVLRNPIHDKTVPIVDRYRREKAYRTKENATVHYKEGEYIQHPKYGEGCIEAIRQNAGSVHLQIRFGDDQIRNIDQRWLLRTKYRR